MMRKKIAIVLGSDSDIKIAEKSIEVLKKINVEFEINIISAHRTPEKVREFALNAKKNNFGVIIAIAGKSAALAGVIASHTRIPVIGVPVSSQDLGGMDALLSTVQMPSGIPVACVAIDGGANAAWLAARILALNDDELFGKLENESINMAERIEKKNHEIQQQYNK
ncbi:MAG: 5-(carboxyamino)imidazole ribonucleotide mutase [Synergistaceae bacterium]|nr:5-(carboxyamino)imidazole ribonucleotide mutase [Synergistaceae bacterium]MBR0080872.1 5-(carboxyamino)imidazole ribonucleotide mutase [Synergistaceae bacterium]MBR0233249.1 5-(carboxyamino)imidazole ribonucleotide mutase [Synergistaceae bacterium]MBR0251934.1 5-(carboxyamino)imidazole ribonucleotide mutase [Synergistaceae bacterium]MBR0316334.1 5-(carboxyamino)imidazole ribonucleotide mutase [Synergistaceae bacterium]